MMSVYQILCISVPHLRRKGERPRYPKKLLHMLVFTSILDTRFFGTIPVKPSNSFEGAARAIRPRWDNARNRDVDPKREPAERGDFEKNLAVLVVVVAVPGRS